MNKFKKIIIILFVFLLIGLGVYFFVNYHEVSNIGSNTLGYVEKDVYSHYPKPSVKIAVVSGMHPRENLSKEVLPNVVKNFSSNNNVEIVNYKVVVLDNPDNFVLSRANGEKLVHDFVIPDIKASDFDLVIIGHDHEKGYGDGFYIATPSMDSKSVDLAEKVIKKIPVFNYYKRSTEKAPESTSITNVDNPIVKTGTPLFVYEIPEWLSSEEAYLKSYDLVEASLNALLS
jgi:hypothetical protein